MNKYIHYNATCFDPSKFDVIKNKEYGCVKPTGGFWASPVDTEWGWKQWCESEQFYTERLKKSFTFKLRDDARVCHLKSVCDLEKLPRIEKFDLASWYCIDFEKSMEEWDAIQIHLSDEIKDRYDSGLYYALYGWDCDSILIMNPDIIVA